MFAHSTGFDSSFISRLLMVFGSSFAFVCLLVIAITWFPTRYFTFFAGAAQFIGTMGPLLAGRSLVLFITKVHGNWRAALSLIGVVGIVLAILILLIVKNKPRVEEQVLIYLTRHREFPHQLTYLFKDFQIWYIAFYSACVYASLVVFSAIWGTNYLESRGLTQVHAAGIISLAWLGFAIVCSLLGVLSDIPKRRKPILIFCGCLGLLSTILRAKRWGVSNLRQAKIFYKGAVT